jgi:MarR family transcriptional regulator, organic hydroperoxide resistance regulator
MICRSRGFVALWYGTQNDSRTGCTIVQSDEQTPTDEILPLGKSIGYQIRVTNRLIARLLQQRIAPYGVSLGMWYFLRALWNEDGLTQRELSLIAGTMEPTTLTAIKSMERSGLVLRKKNLTDKRKINIHLTERGHELKDELLPIARDVVECSVQGFSDQERLKFLDYLAAIQKNIEPLLNKKNAAG